MAFLVLMGGVLVARSYTTRPLYNDNGQPLVNVRVRAFNEDTSVLVETQYTDSNGEAAFTALPSDAQYYFLADWGNNVKRLDRDFTIATKEYWYPPTSYFDNSVPANGVLSQSNNYAGALLFGENDCAFITGKIPHDFVSLTSMEIFCISQSSGTNVDMYIQVSYAAEGEAEDTHTAADANATYTVTDKKIVSMDITSLFSSVVANDFIGVRVSYDGADGGGGYPLVIGMLLKYN